MKKPYQKPIATGQQFETFTAILDGSFSSDSSEKFIVEDVTGNDQWQ